MAPFRKTARGILDLALGLVVGLIVGWAGWYIFGERLLFGFAQFVLDKSLWLSLSIVAIGSIASAIVFMKLWRALFTKTPLATKYNWLTVGAVALACFAISSTGLFLFKSSFA